MLSADPPASSLFRVSYNLRCTACASAGPATPFIPIHTHSYNISYNLVFLLSFANQVAYAALYKNTRVQGAHIPKSKRAATLWSAAARRRLYSRPITIQAICLPIRAQRARNRHRNNTPRPTVTQSLLSITAYFGISRTRFAPSRFFSYLSAFVPKNRWGSASLTRSISDLPVDSQPSCCPASFCASGSYPG